MFIDLIVGQRHLFVLCFSLLNVYVLFYFYAHILLSKYTNVEFYFVSGKIPSVDLLLCMYIYIFLTLLVYVHMYYIVSGNKLDNNEKVNILRCGDTADTIPKICKYYII